MLFHPILNQIANLDMAFLVKPADEQRIEGQTACFCPLCQKEEADDGEQGKAKQTPHLIIYNNERGGMYNGVGGGKTIPSQSMVPCAGCVPRPASMAMEP